jgi:hypothetical protein
MADSATQAPVNTVETIEPSTPEDLGPDSVAIGGLQSGLPNEERAIALLSVVRKNQRYDWQVFVPLDAPDLGTFVSQVMPSVYADIDSKEAQWAALEPKTRTIEDPFTGQTTVVDIPKSEIVRPDIPDYYAKRRAEYPPLAEQLDAMWKGGQAQTDMLAKIQAVKQKYPKPE